ncbi:hypothetical protein PAXRUDRAFT_155862, partial [Paxillus rubicundulus Ve08.2h10]
INWHLQIYLTAIEGHVPPEVVHTFHAFLEFCYLVRHNVITEGTLTQIEESSPCFHKYHEFFQVEGIVTTFSLPSQHMMKHYVFLIQQFGAPNGLGSSITESWHMKAIKKPYWRTNHNKALRQMLVINQRLDKLSASRIDFREQGMLQGTCLSSFVEALGKFTFSTFSHFF